MQPIATYSEVRFDGSRTFTLLPDRIVVRGKQSLQSEFEMTIPLKTLDSSPDTLRFRNQMFTGAMWGAVVSFVGCTVLVSGFHMSFATSPPVLVGGIGVSSIIVMLATFRKVEFIRFKNDDGIVILDIARSGKSAAQLDSFIDALTKQIRESREAT